MKYTTLLFLSIVLFSSCRSKKDNNPAKDIIEKSIAVYGGEKFDNFSAEFDFRDYHFTLMHITDANGSLAYEYTRSTKDSSGNTIKDILTNENFRREINGSPVSLTEKETLKYKEAVNSVAYFVLLPYKLSDKAVNLEHLGTVTFKGKVYDKIKVWFDQEGGGHDFEDVYCYWINQETNMLDFLAYANGGPRFRKAMNRQTINGLTFQDYENYVITDTLIQTQNYDEAFTAGKDSLLSLIENKNTTVK